MPKIIFSNLFYFYCKFFYFPIIFSDTLLQHAQLLQHSYYQKPDNVLRRRKKLGKLLNDVPNEDVSNNNIVARYENNHQANPLVKAAVWTMTLSMGVMTFLVLNTNKYW